MRYITLTIVLLVYSACAVLAETRDWSFVQTIGGLKVGTPYKSKGVWLLPIQSDVSGLQTVTIKPTALNSVLSCKRTNAKIKNNSIYLTIVTGLASREHNSLCPPAILGNIPVGKYLVFYGSPAESPVSLGIVTVGL